jgi:hypothetical protein
MAEAAANPMWNSFLQLPAEFAREVGDVDKPDLGAPP